MGLCCEVIRVAVIVVVFGYGGNLLLGRGLHMLHVRHEERRVCVCVCEEELHF